MGLRVNCPWHKSYTAKRPPRSRCDTCWGIYDLVHEILYRQTLKDNGRPYVLVGVD